MTSMGLTYRVWPRARKPDGDVPGPAPIALLTLTVRLSRGGFGGRHRDGVRLDLRADVIAF